MAAPPDRSDAHIPVEEAARKEAETRVYFDGISPVRHSKPSRSDYSAVYKDKFPNTDEDRGRAHPELDKFEYLEAHTEKLVSEGDDVQEEFIETEYYKDLDSVGKQHHRTGTGFIIVDESNGAPFHLSNEAEAPEHHSSCKGNPATNEWTPSADRVLPVSHKPPRSDN